MINIDELDKLPDPNSRTPNEWTRLHTASHSGTPNYLERIINCGDNVNCLNIFNQTPLHLAIENPHYAYENTELLIKNKANVDIQDVNGNTPLHNAILYDKPKTAKLLIDNGAGIHILGSHKLDVIGLIEKNYKHEPERLTKIRGYLQEAIIKHDNKNLQNTVKQSEQKPPLQTPPTKRRMI